MSQSVVKIQPGRQPERQPAVDTRPTRRAGLVRAFWPPMLWAAVLFGLSSIPGHHIPDVGFSLGDKVAHCIVYGVMGGLCYRALVLATRLRGARAVGAAILLALAYGVSDEIHQMFVPQRSSDLLDVLADVVGGSLGALTALAYGRVRRRRDPRPTPDTLA